MTRCFVADLNGKDFRARVELTNKDNLVVAAMGETCERVNPDSLPWLLDQHLIEQTEEAWQDLSQSAAVAPLETAVAEAPIETRTEGAN